MVNVNRVVTHQSQSRVTISISSPDPADPDPLFGVCDGWWWFIKIHMKTWNMHDAWVTSTYNTIYITMHMIIQICLVTDIIPIQTEREREKECDKIKNKIERERERKTADESCIRTKQIASSIVPLVSKQKYDHTPKFEMFRATMLFGCILRTMCANTSNG